jgi:hypothetical protein
MITHASICEAGAEMHHRVAQAFSMVSLFISGSQLNSSTKNVGPVDFEQEIALTSRMCSGQPNCAHRLNRHGRG